MDKSHQGLGRDGGLKPLVISRIDNRAWPLFDPLDFTFQVIDFDAKRLHYFMTMLHANERWLAATSEAISICVDMTTRRSTAWPADRLERLAPCTKRIRSARGRRKSAAALAYAGSDAIKNSGRFDETPAAVL